MTRGALNAKAPLRTITNEDVERFERQGSQYERRRKGLSTPNGAKGPQEDPQELAPRRSPRAPIDAK